MTGADLSDPALFWSLLVTAFALDGLWRLIDRYQSARYAEDDAGSGRWKMR